MLSYAFTAFGLPQYVFCRLRSMVCTSNWSDRSCEDGEWNEWAGDGRRGGEEAIEGNGRLWSVALGRGGAYGPGRFMLSIS